MLVTLGVIGNSIAVLAVFLEQTISHLLFSEYDRLWDEVDKRYADKDEETKEKLQTEDRNALIERKRKRDSVLKLAIAALIVSSGAVLTWDAIMNDEKQGEFVTAKKVEALLRESEERQSKLWRAEVSKLGGEQSEIGGRVKKLEDHVFRPPPGASESLQEAINRHEQMIASLSRRIKNIHDNEIRMMQLELIHLREELEKLRKQDQRRQPGY